MQSLLWKNYFQCYDDMLENKKKHNYETYSNSSGRSAHSAVQTVKKTKTRLELGNLHAKLAGFRNRSAPG